MNLSSLSALWQALIPHSQLQEQLEQQSALVQDITVETEQSLRLTCLLDQPLPVDLLCRLEAEMEEQLAIKEVTLCQYFAEDLDVQASSAYAASLQPWLLRHLEKQDVLAASLVRRAVFCQSDSCVYLELDHADSILPEQLAALSDCFHDKVAGTTSFCLRSASARQEELSDYARRQFQAHTSKANQIHAENGAKLAAEKPAPARTRAKGAGYGRINQELKQVPIASLDSETGQALIEGQVFEEEVLPVSNGTRLLFKFNLTDKTSSIACLLFAKPVDEARINDILAGGFVRLSAEISFDSQFSKDLRARVLGLVPAQPWPLRQDQADSKRVELHAHTKMSAKDAVCEPAELVRLAARLGHPAVAITDHGVVQAFPDAAQACAKEAAAGRPIKLIYGMEGYLVDDFACVAYLADSEDLSDGFVALDVETTGLDSSQDKLIEVAAVHFAPDGRGGFSPADQLVSYIQPGLALPDKIKSITGITDEMLVGAPAAAEVMLKLAAWLGKRPLVAHNALFDLGFLRQAGQELDPPLKFNPPLFDTLALARTMLPDLKNHRLATVASHLAVTLDQAHRAAADAVACGQIFCQLWQKSAAKTGADLNRLAGRLSQAEVREHKRKVHHITLLAGDKLGLYHLYRLVSLSHLDYFHSRPRLPRSLISYFGHGLIIGSACEAGEVFSLALEHYLAAGRDLGQALAGLDNKKNLPIGRFYDYFEVMPLSNNQFYLSNPDSGLTSQEDLQNLVRLILAWGKKLRKPVCATGDVHFLEKDDAILRAMLMAADGYPDFDEQAELYFHTTDDMLAEFSYLEPEDARDVVINNTQAIARRVSSELVPFPAGSYPPVIETADDDIRELTWTRAQELYLHEGQLPEQVKQRIEEELKSIIENDFSVMYYIAHRLVKKSNQDGYLVGSRGSVGSSLVAYLCGITEVNPLAPHYLCPACRYASFAGQGEYGSGFDLPAQDCPECGTALLGEGQDIPFATFLGFTGDKQPDIDLNFSGEYQPRAHKYTEEMFGQGYTYRAGTISGFALKNAQAIVHKYFEAKQQPVTQAEVSRLAAGLIGVRRTTGQHPGGIVVVPKDREIYDFTPVQYPANRAANGIVTTHFDFNALQETILKLDILGHDDPTMLRLLGDMTGVDVATIPVPDPQVMTLFTSSKALGFGPDDLQLDSATLGLPEMGTFMARDMIKETQPTRFYDLVQLMGLSHGTDVWKGNAQDLIRQGICTIEQVIGCRDSIMTELIYDGLPAKEAFTIMEQVRKGRGLTQEQEDLMRQNKVQEWYIESCKKIRYMFPKAHAVAYTISALRIAWFKINYPEAYYCAYFTVRAVEFDCLLMCRPQAQIRQEREKLRRNWRENSDKEQRTYYILEIVEEMLLRGIRFLPVDLHKSAAQQFLQVGPGQILPPLDSIPAVSPAVAGQIAAARQAGPFKTQDELERRAGLGPAIMENLREAGCLADLPQSSQISLFDLM